MNEKIQEILAKYPVLAQIDSLALAKLGITPAEMSEAKAAVDAKLADVAPGQTAETQYGALAWNIVGKNVIRKFSYSFFRRKNRKGRLSSKIMTFKNLFAMMYYIIKMRCFYEFEMQRI